MRESASVSWIWSVGSGPSTGGAGGRPPGFLPVVLVLSARAASLAACSACSRSKRSLARASILARASASLRKRSSRRDSSSGTDMPSGISAWSAASARTISSATSAFNCASILLACSCESAPCRGSTGSPGVGMNLRAVERQSSQLQHAHLARQKQNLDKQHRDLGKEAPAEYRDRVVVGMFVGRKEAERHRIVTRPFQL